MPLGIVISLALAWLRRQRMAGEAVRESEERLRHVLETAQEAFISMDGGGYITAWNPEAERIFGWSAAETQGRLLAEAIIPPKYREAHGRGLDRFIRTGEGPVLGKRIELSALHRNGDEFPVELTISASRLRGEHSFNAFLRDISARKEAEAELRRLAAIVEFSDDAVIGKTLDGIVTSWNRGAEKTYGYTAEEMIGQSIMRFTPPGAEKEIRDILDQVKAGHTIDNVETVRKRKDGALVDILLTVSPLRDTDGRVVGASAMGRDITVRKQAQREAEKLKEEFFALVSHDLRTPLASVKGYSELLLNQEAGPLSEQQTQFLEVICRNTARLERLVSDLLFAAQVEAGTFSIESRTVDIREVLRECVEDARRRAGEKNVELTCEAEAAPKASGDPDRLAQLFDNLLSNALKYTPEGGRVAARLHEYDRQAVVEVQDTGVGIASAEQEFLFERFFRASSADATSAPGVGLGLTIVKAIAEAHGGRVEVESEEKMGSTFRVLLPVTRSAEQA